MLERHLGIGFEPLGGGKSGGQLGGLDRGEEGPGERLVDLHAADIETVTAATLDDDLAGAVVARGSVASAIVGLQPPTAMPAAGQALQKSRPFPHGTARIMRPGACVGGQPGLVGFVGSPIDIALMVLLDQHLPFRPRQLSHAFFVAPDPSRIVSWRVLPYV